jgi:hypothetical protein
LAATGQRFDAWVSFQIVAQANLREGRNEQALAVYREAAGDLRYAWRWLRESPEQAA